MAPKAKKAAGPVLTKSGEVAAHLTLAESRVSNMSNACIGVVNKCLHDTLYIYDIHFMCCDDNMMQYEMIWMNYDYIWHHTPILPKSKLNSAFHERRS